MKVEDFKKKAMTPSNDIETKERFMVQYWDQLVCAWEGVSTNMLVKSAVKEYYVGDLHLELTSLQNISDDDAIECFKLVAHEKQIGLASKGVMIDLAKGWISYMEKDHYGLKLSGWLKMMDYLRSKGYALPFCGISVEQQIQNGWVKIKE